MIKTKISRRGSIFLVAGSAGMATAAFGRGAGPTSDEIQAKNFEVPPRHARRMRWWHEAKFGMFIHWGTYSLIGHQEWVLERQGLPLKEYEGLAKLFKPLPHPARTWAKLAKQAGQKYVVLTTKHHEGFCLWDTKLTNYSAVQQGPRRDLIAEYVEAVRAEGLRVGFYYSLMDWHHPDGERSATDENARKRFVEYTHGLIRELLTNYGKIDVLWYDTPYPPERDSPRAAEFWEAQKMNEMVFKLQPDIVVNNRNGLLGDFSTPEQVIKAEEGGRAWESCMTMNDSWGYSASDDNWKSTKTLIRNLITCANGGGNYLLNIAPKPDGSVSEEAVRLLGEIGKWMDRNGQAIYESDRCNTLRHNYAGYTRKGNTLYMHVYSWPAQTEGTQAMSFYQPPTVVAIGGLRTKVKSARLFASRKKLDFVQEEISVRFTGLPQTPPDDPLTVIEIECDSEPVVDHTDVRKKRQRRGVGI